jgi:hypothetical protein
MSHAERSLWSRRTVLAALAGVLAVPQQARADEPQRIAVFGDSQAQGLAGGLQRMFRSDKTHRVLDRSKISTGLINTSLYDWPAQAQTIATADHPDVAVALFGANDRPPVRIGGRIDPARVAQFRAMYGGRVKLIADSFKDARIPLIWLGHPVVRDPDYTDDMLLLNAIYADASRSEGATFVSTWDVFKDPDGNFSLYGRGLDGQTVRLRADDGVHLTPLGYDVMAALLPPLFVEARLRSL